jgi:hypothetical protein
MTCVSWARRILPRRGSRPSVGLGVLLVAVSLALSVRLAHPVLAAVTRTEAETSATLASGWTMQTSPSTGRSGTHSLRSGTSTSWQTLPSVTVPSGEVGTISLGMWMSVTGDIRHAQVRINGGTAEQFEVPTVGSSTFGVGWSSASLPAGTYTVEISWWQGALTFVDYIELSTSTAPTTTTTTSSTTTTTAPPTTTTTAAGSYNGPTATDFNDLRQEVLVGLALALFLAAAHVAGSWRRR